MRACRREPLTPDQVRGRLYPLPQGERGLCCCWTVMSEQAISRALVSVSDKAGLVEFGRFLAAKGVEILSTGGSAKALRDAGVPVLEVAAYTGLPEMMDGRVKTLHPKIHGGILARRDLPEHRKAMEEYQIGGIDLVVVNLYPFAQTVDSGAGREECIENIDIGGPALIRAAAKNHGFVAVVTDPGDYAAVMDEMAAGDGATTLALRERLARAAFAHTAAYDAAIAGWMNREAKDDFPALLTLAARHRQGLRYGENPHQRAAFYAAIELGAAARPGIATATQLQGKELSYNNRSEE